MAVVVARAGETYSVPQTVLFHVGRLSMVFASSKALTKLKVSQELPRLQLEVIRKPRYLDLERA
jgi:hypothetical protein